MANAKEEWVKHHKYIFAHNTAQEKYFLIWTGGTVNGLADIAFGRAYDIIEHAVRLTSWTSDMYIASTNVTQVTHSDEPTTYSEGYY